MCTDMVTFPQLGGRGRGAMTLSTMFSHQQRPRSDNLAAATSPAHPGLLVWVQLFISI